MRIGALDWSQLKDTKKNETAPRAKPLNPMISSPSDNTTNGVSHSGVSPNGAAPQSVPSNGVPQNEAAPAAPVAATGAPGSGAMGAPGSGVPGASAARGGRTVMWKGKTLNMDTTRSALAQAAEEEQRVAQTPSAAATNGAMPTDASTQALHEHIATILTGMNEMCGGLQEIYGTVSKIADRDSNSERVFNTLHAELSDYKKDFIYEHLKPVIRPLLFLYDSLEQFEGETQRFGEAAPTTAAGTSSTPPAPVPGMMPTRAVRQNTVYFREQLVEALRICEVTPMETPSGAFNPRFHKAVKTVSVAPEADGQIQSVIRSGWFLNGQLLRAAEVVVGKAVVSGQ